MTRFFIVATLAITFLLAPSRTTAQSFEPYTFEVEVTKTVEAERGEIMVPENRSDPDSRRIPIRFVRLESRAENPGAPIVYLAGGPGGAGTGVMRGQRWLMFDRLRDVADVIILDQRGTGLSDEVPRCTSSVAIPPDSATTRARYVSAYRLAMQECLGFWQREGVDIRGYTTWESAADIDAVRKALRAEQVSLLGISYGTHLALAMLKRYPKRIDRLVLASAEGLDQTVKLPARTEAYFRRLQAAIDADSAARASYPDVKALIQRVMNQVEADPPRLEIPEGRDNPAFRHTMGRFELQRITGYMLSDPNDVSSILEAYAAAAEGDYGWFRRYFDYAYDGATISLNGMPEAMDVASGISSERLTHVKAQADTALLGDALNFPMPHLHGTIPGIDLGEDFRKPVRSDRPVLLLSGTLDGRTYPEAHEEIAEGFSNGAIVTIENAGHNLFFSHPDVVLFFSHPDVVEIVADFFGGAPAEQRTLTAPPPSFVDDD